MLRLTLCASLFLLAGCATVTGVPTQSVDIHALDADGRSISGMRCRIANGSAEYFATTPVLGLQVRRSSRDLHVECRRGTQLAHGIAVSRGSKLGSAASALLPGGTASLMVDHLSGYRYDYPATLHLRVGEKLVFDVNAAPISRGAVADTGR